MSALDEQASPFSIEELFASVQPRLRRLFARFRIPPEDAEDLLQQSFLDLFYKQDSIHHPEAWLLATVKNRCIVYWRSKRRQFWDAMDGALLEILAEPQPPLQRQVALKRDLERVLSRLPSRCRDVLRLRYGFGYQSQEVADRLGYQASSIRKVTSRCIAALSRELVDSGIDPLAALRAIGREEG